MLLCQAWGDRLGSSDELRQAPTFKKLLIHDARRLSGRQKYVYDQGQAASVQGTRTGEPEQASCCGHLVHSGSTDPLLSVRHCYYYTPVNKTEGTSVVGERRAERDGAGSNMTYQRVICDRKTKKKRIVRIRNWRMAREATALDRVEMAQVRVP